MEEFFGANKQQTGMTKVLGEIVAQKKGRRWATIQTQLELSLSCGGAVMPSTRAFQWNAAIKWNWIVCSFENHFHIKWNIFEDKYSEKTFEIVFHA